MYMCILFFILFNICVRVFQMKEGRRTSSLKASYEAVKNNDFLGREFALSRDTSGYSSSALASTLTQPLTSNNSSDSRTGRKTK